ncbi:MAG: sigma 54-interacting transcriptional regulator [Thermoanaerobaculales bacterium]
MVEQFKARLAERIRQKDIGLVMIVDRGGRIRWHHGRPVGGRTVEQGWGFSRTHLLEVLGSGNPLETSDVTITGDEHALPHSARLLLLGSLFIHPIDDDLVLYVDSGRDSLDPSDIEFFTSSGNAIRSLLSELRSVDGRGGGITGDSPAARRMRELVMAFGLEDDPVLILGETGVGKSRIAQLIHRFSGRSGQFIIIDSPAVPEPLFESELFGHARGAFTGADRAKRGLVEAAESGTLFLDEIAEVPLSVQAKLLRFIDTHRFRAVGDPRERQIDVRIIAATNRKLEDEIARQRFREDLFFRLNVLTLEIPPLRERPEDIRALILEHERFLRGKELGPGFWQAVERHDWPGNVRELVSVVKRAGIQVSGRIVGDEVEELLMRRRAPSSARAEHDDLAALRVAIEAGESFWDAVWPLFLDRELNRRQLRGLLEDYFWQCHHSLKDLAQRLNIPDRQYPRFISALHRYRVHPGRPAPPSS